MNIIIKTLNKTQYKLKVSPNMTIMSAIEIIADKLKVNILPHTIKLIYCGRILKNNKIFSDYGITDGKTIIMIINKKKNNVAIGHTSDSNNNQSFSTSDVPSVSHIFPALSAPHTSRTLSESEITQNEQPSLRDMQLLSGSGTILSNLQDLDNYDPNSLYTRLLISSYNIFNSPNFREQLLREYPNISESILNNESEFQEAINNPNFLTDMMTVGPIVENISTSGLYETIPAVTSNLDSYETMLPAISNPDSYETALTQHELIDVDQLVSLGFDKNYVIQMYLTCDKNLEKTARIL
jgi:uncharacterized ubiquitin-like protein YukD